MKPYMPLAWTEIRTRAINFSKGWAGAARERAEAQTFWNEFFEVFGIRRRTVATFEEPVKNLKGDTDFIDLFWKGRLIAEHKSLGKDLAQAHTQAIGYIQELINEGREEEAPRYILVSDFARIALHDLEPEDPARATVQFNLADFPRHVRHFAFIAGYETRQLDPEDPANIKAAELLANVHDRLEEVGYVGHDLQRFMVRILFCLFADDTGIFEPDTFRLFVERQTRPDGSDLGAQLARFFAILNTPEDARPTNLDEDLSHLPYVNGDLFAEGLAFPQFDTPMRTALTTCCSFHWERISPAIFGSLFQSIMQPRQRRQIGAHYTSERDILKLIRSLFLDDLRAEFESVRNDKRKLETFHRRLGGLRFLDPACGCGNFLVISYRELRRLEMDVLDARFGAKINEGDVRAECRITVSQFYGIEIEEWAVRIAEVALWLMDHQMNQELFKRFSQVRPSVPLTSSPHIRPGNALRIDWNDLLPAAECSYVLGNPPFVGAKFQTDKQKEDMDAVAQGVRGRGLLDYVTGWYFKAAEYIVGTGVRVAFVSTNSVTQGEQVGVLWSELFRRGVKIHFAHRTFAWTSEARRKAHVHVVIVGWGLGDCSDKRIYDYETDPQHATVSTVRNISPYLIEGENRAITNRSKPLCDSPAIGIGNKPIDGGNYLFTPQERDTFLAKEPEAKVFFRPWIGSQEFLNGGQRWCLWLGECGPSRLRQMPECLKRVEAVRDFRLKRDSEPTRKLAEFPTRFHVENMPGNTFLVIPKVSSERRRYIPIGFMDPRTLVSDLVFVLPDAGLYHFGVLSSEMHMAWVRQVCGRLESRYRYSNKLVYNNFPWPGEVTDKQKARVEQAAQGVLDARKQFPESTLADLYDPLAMPPDLVKAHAVLDRAVDACYRAQPFTSERQRVEFLFALYEKLTAPLTATRKKPRRRQAGE
ncbi:MAG: hypothetical protein BIFFINMI_04108 [Phycisphaerae bacterium]|nr:hypothetical protein [Phycisphaerae bacterium]